ncbi:putative thiol-specific monooxygenase [Podospora aff. communis PSN243]|uniref:Thiol-specific monooxygenase n=1 Tax=Podospora aff. communis PSN243 TaxID=3040156 RepID=A0AAV9GW91_9PEZI|nr:putative thiol-specific monooxygenase [Podospora aff. communis PSN243]
MAFSDLPFPRDSLVFPSRDAVQDYLVAYSGSLRHLVRFSTRVENIRLWQSDGKDRWDVTFTSLETNRSSTTTYDAVVVASGHYSLTYLPEIKGIRDFHSCYPGVISHAKLYRTPAPYAKKKVILVGNAASGLDIGAQISGVCRKPLLLSVQTATPRHNLDFIQAEEVGVIEEFLVNERGVRFRDGRIEKDLDAIIFATGYLFSYPFLSSLKPQLVKDGRRVHGLYQELFHIEHPALVFPGLPIKVVPFSVCESQAAIISRTWANRLPLPTREEMHKWEEEEAEKRGASFHVWPKGGDAEFVNAVHERLREGVGKKPPRWDDELMWERQVYADAKLKFEMEGRSAKSLAELGFVYSNDGIQRATADGISLFESGWWERIGRPEGP